MKLTIGQNTFLIEPENNIEAAQLDRWKTRRPFLLKTLDQRGLSISFDPKDAKPVWTQAGPATPQEGARTLQGKIGAACGIACFFAFTGVFLMGCVWVAVFIWKNL